MGRKPGQNRQRMLDSAVALLRERGASSVSIDAVLAHSQTPRGSVYHHFPGGRDELIISAVRQAGDYITGLIDEASTESDPVDALEGFAKFWKQSLLRSGYREGCPIVALAVDHREGMPEAADLVSEIFDRWRERLYGLLVGNGLASDRAQRLATLAVASLEGAVILCRANRDVAPLDQVIAEIAPLYR